MAKSHRWMIGNVTTTADGAQTVGRVIATTNYSQPPGTAADVQAAERELAAKLDPSGGTKIVILAFTYLGRGD